MPDWRTLLDSETLGAWDLKGREWTLLITKVETQKLTRAGGKPQRKAKLAFRGAKKDLIAGATILDTIAKMYGRDYTKWLGKSVTLYPTTCTAFGEAGVPCIRVKPTIPKAPPVDVGPDEPVDPAMRAKQMQAAGETGPLMVEEKRDG